MLNNKGFDEWAKTYDYSVHKQSNTYPFDGYYKVLGSIHDLIKIRKSKTVLDLGIGTGLLSKVLYESGMHIYGVDFSTEMLSQAKEKMPDAHFFQSNLNYGLPDALDDKNFDYIISSYAFHHLEHQRKITVCHQLMKHLNVGGKLIIGDIGFKTKDDLKVCQQENYKSWDSDEHYMIGDQLIKDFRRLGYQIKYKQISSCAGIFVISKD